MISFAFFCWQKFTWKDFLPLVELAHNRSIHSSTSFSHFEIMYGFNSLTLNLMHLPLYEITNLDI